MRSRHTPSKNTAMLSEIASHDMSSPEGGLFGVMLLAAPEPRDKDRFLGGRVEAAHDLALAVGEPRRGGEARPGELPEAALGRHQCLAVPRIEFVAGITGVVHDDLCCHVGLLLCLARVALTCVPARFQPF